MSEIKIYNLRIIPPNPIYDEVVKLKNKFINAFGKQPLSTSKPHITLVAFEMDVQYEAYLIKALYQLSILKKFKLEIEGFGVFQNISKALIIKVSKTKELEFLLTQIEIIWIRDLHRKPATLTTSTTPHITISKTTGDEMLQDSYNLFKKIKLPYKEIEVSYLTLVSRPLKSTWDWEHQITLS
ncbi:2'-5' RNA ligase family protein [Mariniflexile sp. HNIBRBA6329]|uniref:2'-5' RNA ligase family protein n=1 Tax=Mariniflexile sp. HNIBRBA6329 TaxID=3373088 RepID=UPI0037458CBF